jgi:hypothetical protein
LSVKATSVVHPHLTIPLRAEREIVAALNAIEQDLSERRADPARIELDGRSYTMHPTPGP